MKVALRMHRESAICRECIYRKLTMKKVLPPDTGVNHQISIWIDTYDDIFSDFDSRNYADRNISDDFLQEIKKVAQENQSVVQTLRLLVPAKIRSPRDEEMITLRLQQFILDSYRYNDQTRKTFRKKGVLLVLLGMVVILSAGYFSYLKTQHPIMNIPFVIFEPAGWFITWTGYEYIVRASNKSMPELVFYSKIRSCKIVFENIQ
jgi:hypothetical protein